MDIERAILRTLYYDYPIEVAVRGITNLALKREKNEFLSAFPQVIRWSQPQFTISELRLVEDFLEYESRDIISGEKEIKTNVYRDALCIIPQLAKRWLHYNDKHQLVVCFNELFRWRDIALLVGEDVFTTAYMAWDDIRQLHDTNHTFDWEDVLHHDNKQLDSILNQELIDIHSHYYASVDVFHLNWLSLMNRIKNRVKFDFEKIEYQEQSIALHAVEPVFKFKNICVAAAFLRVQLYKFINSETQKFKLGDFDPVTDILKNDDICSTRQGYIEDEISTLRKDAIKDIFSHEIDYAISSQMASSANSPFLIYNGERKLLYSLFRYVIDADAKYAYDIAPYFYLYLLLKNRVRREIVETNQLLGFENFQIYQKRKNLFIKSYTIEEECNGDSKKKKENDWIYVHIPHFIARMNLANDTKLEVRVAPNGVVDTQNKAADVPIFSSEEKIDDLNKKMTLVAHFMKDSHIRASHQIKAYACREAEEKEKKGTWLSQADLLLDTFENQKIFGLKTNQPPLVGVDAASFELYCRPEQFGLVYRYLNMKGMTNRTFHVGEDFFDLVDGMRAIDEAIEFLGLDSNCRLGHALALGTSPLKYYKDRFYTAVIYKQYMLDSLIWLYYKAEVYNIVLNGRLKAYIIDTAHRLYSDVYKNFAQEHPFDMRAYWYSMWLRSDDYDSYTEKRKCFLFSRGNKKIPYAGTYSSIIKHNSLAVDLWKAYLRDHDVYKDGMETEIFKWPKEIAEVVTQIQDKMIAEIAEKQIAIECNPSSNLKIGHFDRYEEHPIFRFRPIDKNIHTPLLNVSINTDDRGVFATSLYNEFSLIALALTKQRDKDGNRLYNDEAICEYIDHIRQNNLIQRFKV